MGVCLVVGGILGVCCIPQISLALFVLRSPSRLNSCSARSSSNDCLLRSLEVVFAMPSASHLDEFIVRLPEVVPPAMAL